jgi:hypothetical protein
VHVAVPATMLHPNRAGGEVLLPMFIAGGGVSSGAVGSSPIDAEWTSVTPLTVADRDVSVGVCDDVSQCVSHNQVSAAMTGSCSHGSVGRGQYSGERRPRWYVAVAPRCAVVDVTCSQQSQSLWTVVAVVIVAMMVR